ncbi:Calcium-dependent protein kinase 8 [Entophlyctis luteolus]|nr:Calcium-dependent protein kinase 8 [Entophlyctis luteolus]
MDDLVLDSGKEHDQATQGLLQDEPVADVDVEHQRLTFANITKNVSEQNAENLEEKLNPLSSYSSEQVTSTYSNFIDGSVGRVPKTTASGIHKLRWFQPLLSKSLPGFSTSVKSSPPHSPRNFPALPDETTMYESRDKKNEYRTIKQLGKGAQGVVSYSVHVATNSKVAFKAIPIYSMVDGNVRESFRREIVILKKLQGHRNVIKLLDCWEGKAKVYQVFECCEGGDLSLAIAKAFPMSEKLRGHLFYPIVDAVNFLHSYGILHRDIRPANILIRRPFTSNQAPESLLCLPVLADFGIAMEEKYASGRMLTQFLDRPPHIAPEVVDGHPFGRPADVFGLGVCLITILLNRPIDICDQDKTLVSRESAWARLSAMEKRLVKKLLEVNPKQRLTALEAVNDEWFKAAGVV